MDLRSIDLNLMVAFEALMSERSVTAAATRLGISQPAMSAALARLRTLFNDALFVRTGRAMLPTARAALIEAQVAQGLAQLRAALQPPSAFNAKTSRRVFTVSAGDYATAVILPHLAAYVARHAPAVDLRFRFVEKAAAFDMLDSDALDLALGVFPGPPKRLAVQALFEERFVSVARRGHPALRQGLTLEAFAALPHLLITERGDATGVVDDALGQVGLARRVALTVPHVLVAPSVLSGTDFVATVGARVARLFAGLAPVSIYDTPLPLAPWRLTMVWSRQKSGDAGLAWLRGRLLRIGAKV